MPYSSKTSKNIVLFLDGTNNEFGSKPHTNVLRLFQMAEKNSARQVCYYQPGIGARFSEESEDNWFTDGIDQAIATSLSRHVMSAYNFLVSHYETGDKIYLIGFSRGSFTCRVLAGMIERIGLLYRGLEHLTSQAWSYYSNYAASKEQAQSDVQDTLYGAFRITFCRTNIEIYFMGIYDSVNSVGLLRDRIFPYVRRSRIVVHTRHAISLDERRAKFKALFIKDTEKRVRELDESNVSKGDRLVSFKELLFSGNHGDLGGGWCPDSRLKHEPATCDEELALLDEDPWEKEGSYLSGILLRWLLKEAQDCGLRFLPWGKKTFNRNQPIENCLFAYWHDPLALKSSRQVPPVLISSMSSMKAKTRFGFKADAEVPSPLKKLDNLPKILNRFNGRGFSAFYELIFWWILEFIPFIVKVEEPFKENESAAAISSDDAIDERRSSNSSQESLRSIFRIRIDWSRKFRKQFTPNFGKHRSVGYAADYHWSVFYRIHFITNYKPRNIEYRNESCDDLWALGTKFVNLLKGREVEFARINLWNEIELFGQKLNSLVDDSPQHYLDLIKKDTSKFWSYIPDDFAPSKPHHLRIPSPETTRS